MRHTRLLFTLFWCIRPWEKRALICFASSTQFYPVLPVPAASWLVLSVVLNLTGKKLSHLRFVVRSAKTTNVSVQPQETNIKVPGVCFITLFFTTYLGTQNILYMFLCLINSQCRCGQLCCSRSEVRSQMVLLSHVITPSDHQTSLNFS